MFKFTTLPAHWLERSTETRDTMSLGWYLASVFPGNNFTVTLTEDSLHVISHNNGLDPVQIEQEVRTWFWKYQHIALDVPTPINFTRALEEWKRAHPVATDVEIDRFFLNLLNTSLC